MTELLSLIGGESKLWSALSIATLLAARVAPLSVLAPWMAFRGAPAWVRITVIVMLTASFYSVAAHSVAYVPEDEVHLAILAMRELVLGVLFSIAAFAPLYAMSWSGQLMDAWRGSTMSDTTEFTLGEHVSPLGNLYWMMGVILFCALGGHTIALRAFADGLKVAPIGVASLGNPQLTLWPTARIVGSALTLSVSISAPIAITVVLIEIGLGLVSRVASQIPMFFVGMPVRAWTALAVAMLSLTWVVQHMPYAFREALDHSVRLWSSLSP